MNLTRTTRKKIKYLLSRKCTKNVNFKAWIMKLASFFLFRHSETQSTTVFVVRESEKKDSKYLNRRFFAASSTIAW